MAPGPQEKSAFMDDVISLFVRWAAFQPRAVSPVKNTNHLSLVCDDNEAQMLHFSGYSRPHFLILFCHINTLTRTFLFILVVMVMGYCNRDERGVGDDGEKNRDKLTCIYTH